MLIGFFDDTDLVVDNEDVHPDIFAYGGYLIDETRLAAFQDRIGLIKGNYGLSGNAPVKWNIRDTTLCKFYKHESGLSPDSYQDLVTHAVPLRRDLLALLAEFEATVFVSARYDRSKNPERQATYSTWAFENLLQRIGMLAQYGFPNGNSPGFLLVADWPSATIEKGLSDVYLGGYHYGHGFSTHQNYYSGALRQFGFADTLCYGSTLHSGPLQIADLVAGCCKDFIQWAWKGERRQRIDGLFDLLIDRFYRDPQGTIHNAGFVMTTKSYRFIVDAKIEEYLHTIPVV